MSQIPQRSRQLVYDRQDMRCWRCSASARVVAGSWHHRRGRAVVDDHTHCTCNGVWLCGDGVGGCHGWVHGRGRFEASRLGLIVPRGTALPGSVPMAVAPFGEYVELDCVGGFRWTGIEIGQLVVES